MMEETDSAMCNLRSWEEGLLKPLRSDRDAMLSPKNFLELDKPGQLGAAQGAVQQVPAT